MATNIRRCRLSADMSQKQVAFRLGVSTQSISYWECGHRVPSSDKLLMLARIYNTTVDHLLGRDAPDQIAGSTIKHDVRSKLDALTDDQLIELRGYIQGKFGV